MFRWPRSLPVNVLESSGEQNVVSYATLPEGNRTRTIGSLKTGTLQTWLRLEPTQRRDGVSQQGAQMERFKWRLGREEKEPYVRRGEVRIKS